MCKVMVRPLFQALILITMLALVIPAYPGEKQSPKAPAPAAPATTNPPNVVAEEKAKEQLGKEEPKTVKDETKTVKEKIEQLEKNETVTKNNLNATTQKVDAIGIFIQLLVAAIGVGLAILVIFVIRYYSKHVKKYLKEIVNKLDQTTQKIDQRYIDRQPAIWDVSPKEGDLFGGSRITILGSNFDDRTKVWIGEQPARVVAIENKGEKRWEISAETPAIDLKERTKSVDVKIETPWGANNLREYFVYNWPTLDFSPFKIPKEGKWVMVRGTGFGQDMKVKICDNYCETRYVEKDCLFVYFPPGNPGNQVMVDVVRKYSIGEPDSKSQLCEYV